MFILKFSRYSDKILLQWVPCPVSQRTPKYEYIFLDISLDIPLYGFCLLWWSGYLQTLLGRHPKPNSFLCSGQIVRSSPHSSNSPTRAKHNLPSSSTPSREVLKQPRKCSFVLLGQFFTIKIDPALLFRAERLHSFLEYCWKEQTHLKSPIIMKCRSAGMAMHGKRGKCRCLVRVKQSSQRVTKIMPSENKNSWNILNLYFRYT